jgi:hypothetical protein
MLCAWPPFETSCGLDGGGVRGACRLAFAAGFKGFLSISSSSKETSMKKTLLLTIVFTLWATMAFAQTGLISLFADTGGNDCNLLDTAAPNNWHFVHMSTPGATAIQFLAVLPGCYPGIHLSDQKPFPVTTGDSQIGVAVAYGSCAYPVVGDPNSPTGTITVTDCAFIDHPNVPSHNGMINSNAGCLCLVPTRETTWGQIKSLYRSAD